jgi:hypothetical protein
MPFLIFFAIPLIFATSFDVADASSKRRRLNGNFPATSEASENQFLKIENDLEEDENLSTDVSGEMIEDETISDSASDADFTSCDEYEADDEKSEDGYISDSSNYDEKLLLIKKLRSAFRAAFTGNRMSENLSDTLSDTSDE